MRLRATLAMAAATLLLATRGALAETAQQAKMKSCNAEATQKSLKGDERKSFMKTCLSASAPATQQEKMKTCNKDASAKGLKGDARKSFMSSCLSGQ